MELEEKNTQLVILWVGSDLVLEGNQRIVRPPSRETFLGRHDPPLQANAQRAPLLRENTGATNRSLRFKSLQDDRSQNALHSD